MLSFQVINYDDKQLLIKMLMVISPFCIVVNF